MALTAGALLICVYAVTLLVRFSPMYVPVECHGVEQPLDAAQTVDSRGQATLQEPIIQCFNHNPYSVHLSYTRSGQVFAMPERAPIGWATVEPVTLPEHGSAFIATSLAVRTGGREDEFAAQLEFVTRGYSEMGLFLTVVTAVFEQATTCAMTVRPEAGGLRRGPPVCAGSAGQLPSGAPHGTQGAGPAPVFELNLDTEAFRQANRVMQAICGLLMGISALLGVTTCFTGSWLLIWRRRCAKQQEGALAARSAALASRHQAAAGGGRGPSVALEGNGEKDCSFSLEDGALFQHDPPNDDDPPPVCERPTQPESTELCNPCGRLSRDSTLAEEELWGQAVAEAREGPPRCILHL